MNLNKALMSRVYYELTPDAQRIHEHKHTHTSHWLANTSNENVWMEYSNIVLRQKGQEQEVVIAVNDESNKDISVSLSNGTFDLYLDDVLLDKDISAYNNTPSLSQGHRLIRIVIKSVTNSSSIYWYIRNESGKTLHHTTDDINRYPHWVIHKDIQNQFYTHNGGTSFSMYGGTVPSRLEVTTALNNSVQRNLLANGSTSNLTAELPLLHEYLDHDPLVKHLHDNGHITSLYIALESLSRLVGRVDGVPTWFVVVINADNYSGGYSIFGTVGVDKDIEMSNVLANENYIQTGITLTLERQYGNIS